MVHISINTAGKLPMEDLWKLTLKFCFDKKNLSFGDERKMRSSCFLWNKTIEDFKANRIAKYGVELDSRPVGTKGTYIDEMEFYLGIICMHISAEDHDAPWLKRRKAIYKEHGINYLKAYGVPGSWTKDDFVKAMKAQKRAMIDNPGDYT